MDPSLLRPIRRRGERAQMDVMIIRTPGGAGAGANVSGKHRARGLVKALGERLPKVDAEGLGIDETSGLPEALRKALQP